MKGRKTILFVVEVAVFSALALAFDFFCGLYGFAWLNGGSISIAMLPIFIMCYRHGLKGGLLCGLLVGSIQLLWADGFVHPVQAIIDYPAAYLVTGFAGILTFSKSIPSGNPFFNTSLAILLSIFSA